MGYMRHHAMVVTGWGEKYLPAAHKYAKSLLKKDENLSEKMISPIIKSPMNGYASFLIAPDGSKEGWGHSNSGDAFREKMVRFLSSKKGGYLAWAEIQYGDDSHIARLVNASDFVGVVE